MNSLLRLTGSSLLAVGIALGTGGCGPAGESKTTASATGGTTAATDPWPKFVAAIRNAPDPKATRGVVADLSAGLSTNPNAEQPNPGDPDTLDAIVRGLNLTPAERNALRGGEFTPLDANHLSECLYLYDVVAALGVYDTDPAPVRADAAFRFVCRQVVLNPWQVGATAYPPVPPSFVLNRGSGSGLERAYVFVALCRQLDLDAYFIGPATAAERNWTYTPPETTGFPRGPFWAVGVRHAGGILLYDPWRGERVPTSAAEDRPATLAELRADPNLCPWVKDETNRWEVSADEIKASGLFISPPLQSLAPRMALMHEKLKAEVGVQVATDWGAAVRAAEGAADGAPVLGWNPTGDESTPVRVLGTFIPPEQGGEAGAGNSTSIYGLYQANLLPIDKVLRTPVEVISRGAEEALRRMAAEAYGQAFLVTPTPRERIQRGRYIDATGYLVKQRDRFEDLLQLGRGTGTGAEAEQLRRWYSDLNDVFDRVSRARNAGDAAEAAATEQTANKFLQASALQVGRVVGGMIAEVGLGEANYQLALASHEQAESLQQAVDRANRDPNADPARTAELRPEAKRAWVKAASGWRRYSELADALDSSFPGRKATANALLERAERLAK